MDQVNFALVYVGRKYFSLAYLIDELKKQMLTVDITVVDILRINFGMACCVLSGFGFLWSFSTVCRSILSSKSPLLAVFGANCIFGIAEFFDNSFPLSALLVKSVIRIAIAPGLAIELANFERF